MSKLWKKDILNAEESNRKSLLIGYYNYTVVLTYIGMLVGFLGIMYAAKEQPTKALICLMLSGFCDMFDGAVASTRKRTKREKRFGIQIDSLCDLICFGVLPAVIVNYQTEEKFALLICGMYVLSALIRLSYFNVDEEDRQDKSEGKRKFYKGMPVTTIALILPFAFQASGKTNLLLSVLFASSLAFLLPIKIKKPNQTMKIIMLIVGACAFFNVFMGLL